MSLNPHCVLILIVSVLPFVARCNTDQSDVSALQGLYNALNSPPQLTNWISSGGDPCGGSWKGITCKDSAVVAVEIPELGVTGTMGYLFSSMMNLKKIDMSKNNLNDGISYQLPPNLVSLNLAENNLTGNFPYSISTLSSLTYLNVSHNKLNPAIPDFFSGLTNLKTLDLSFNNFSGDLPHSFGSLSSLSELDIQNNKMNGSIDIVKSLPLTTLNAANNNFSGLIPQELLSIPHFTGDGNSFENNPIPSSPADSSSPSRNAPKSEGHHSSPSSRRSSSQSKSNKGLKLAAIIGICFGIVIVSVILLLLIVFCVKKSRKNSVLMVPRTRSAGSFGTRMEVPEPRVKNMAAVTDLKPLPVEKLAEDGILVNSGSIKRIKSPITATSYTVATLQVATNSFSQENLVGEGSLGRVYKAEFPNGKVMAIKKIDNAALPLQEDDSAFLEAVSSISCLRHPNIVTLIGFCAEHKQRLLVYEFFGKGSLHDILRCSDEGGISLSWNARVKVALGTARALEYLHEVCSPPVVLRNLKSANILLDDDLNPHLSDSGLASLTPNTERQVTMRMIGSFGYSAPEYGLSGVYTIKSDVYSFGVVMLELLTGRKPLDSSRVRSEQSLVRWATPQLHDIDALAKMVDPALNGMYPVKSLSRFADIIALCVQPEPEFRPPMSEVVQALVRLMQRASVVRRSRDELGMSYRTPEHEAIEMAF